MNQSLSYITCALPIALGAALLAPGNVQAQGRVDAVGSTSSGTRATAFTYAAGPTKSVVTSHYALVAFALGTYGKGIADDGTVLISTNPGVFRWRAGIRADLTVPAGGDFVTTNLNRQGNLLGYTSKPVQEGSSCLDTQLGWYWPAGQATATEVNNPFTITRAFDECGGGLWEVKGFTPALLDGANRIWASYGYGDAASGDIHGGLARWDSATSSPVDMQQDAQGRLIHEFIGVNSGGTMIGRRSGGPGNIGEWFIGAQAVDFEPVAINDAGWVIGLDGFTDASVLWRNGQADFLGGFDAQLINDRGDIVGDTPNGLVFLPAGDVSQALNVVSFDYTPYLLKSQMPAGWEPWEVKGLNATGALVGTGLYRDPAATSGPYEIRAFVLLPAALRVDANRDGAIEGAEQADNPDLELVRKSLPWFFWLNDDDDAGETDGSDIPGKGPNSADGVVNGVRDLVDFFPVQLDIAALLQVFPPSDTGNSYRLAQAEGAANFLTTELTPDKAGDYQRDAAIATTLGDKAVTQITAAGVALAPEFLGRILTKGEGIILVEASKATTAPLRLEVWRGGQRMAGIELPLSFAGVEQMFRHANLTGAVGITAETDPRGGVPNGSKQLENNKAFVFVHGYNVNQQQARGWQAEFFKRLWWSGSRAQFWGVTWYGSDSQVPAAQFTPNYQLNVVHAFGTAPVFKQFIDELRSHAGVLEINVAAHSLGNMVVSSAIADHGAGVNRYFLLNAAVAAEAYDATETSNPVAIANMPHTTWTREYGTAYPAQLWASNWHERFPQAGDARRSLTWQDRFANRGTTACYDFFSTGDHVLALDTEDTPSLTGVLAGELGHYLNDVLSAQSGQPNGYRTWAYQEKLKGRTITGKVLGSNYGGWGFNTFHFKNRTGGYGKGPVLSPAVLTPSEAQAMLPLFTDEVLRVEPFFRPGSNWAKVGTWLPNANGGRTFSTERLGTLYGSDGSAFAGRHHDTLLARMIPALSLVAGQDSVEQFGSPSTNFNFDINAPVFRGTTAIPPWPQSRNGDTRWRHSDLRVVAYPYVKKLYDKLVETGALDQQTP